MRLLLLVNPSATAVTPASARTVRAALARHHDVTVVETARRGHATLVAADAPGQFDAVLALGGDGTLNEVANALAGTPCALGVLPGGSTNVLARTIGLPRDPEAAADALALAATQPDPTRLIGLGSANGRYFLVNAGMGFDAAVVHAVERHPTWKRRFGPLSFVGAALGTWVRGVDRDHPTFRVEIEGADGELPPVEGFLAIALNSDPYTFLGGRPLTVAPGTALDGPLALLTLGSLRAGRLVRVVTAALAGHGHLDELPDVQVCRGVERAVVRGHRPFPYQVDGDDLGPTDEVVLRHVPDALHLLVPR